MVYDYAIPGKEKYKGCGVKLDNRYIGLSGCLLYEWTVFFRPSSSCEGPKENLFSMLILTKEFLMLDSVGTTELLAAILYHRFVSDGLN